MGRQRLVLAILWGMSISGGAHAKGLGLFGWGRGSGVLFKWMKGLTEGKNVELTPRQKDNAKLYDGDTRLAYSVLAPSRGRTGETGPVEVIVHAWREDEGDTLIVGNDRAKAVTNVRTNVGGKDLSIARKRVLGGTMYSLAKVGDNGQPYARSFLLTKQRSPHGEPSKGNVILGITSKGKTEFFRQIGPEWQKFSATVSTVADKIANPPMSQKDKLWTDIFWQPVEETSRGEKKKKGQVKTLEKVRTDLETAIGVFNRAELRLAYGW